MSDVLPPAEFKIYCHRAQQRSFAEGSLVPAWAEAYPMLFDEDDRRLADSQKDRHYHFWEWATAIHLYHAYGLHSLVEQYQFLSHRRKQAFLEEVLRLPHDVKDLLDRKKNKGPQGPDSLVFRPSEPKEWFFCEVKGGGDRLRPEQDEFFAKLSSKDRPLRRATGVFLKDWPLPSTNVSQR